MQYTSTTLLTLAATLSTLTIGATAQERSAATAPADLESALAHVGLDGEHHVEDEDLWAPIDFRRQDRLVMPIGFQHAEPYEIEVLQGGTLETTSYAVERDEYAPAGIGLVSGDQVYVDDDLLFHELTVVDDDLIAVGSASLARLGLEGLWRVEGWTCWWDDDMGSCEWTTYGLLRTEGFDLADAVLQVQDHRAERDAAVELAVAVATTHVLALDLCRTHAMSTTSYLPVTETHSNYMEWIRVSVSCDE
jgi:hypothetical protein